MKQFKPPHWPAVIGVAVTVTFGMEIIRTLPPYLQYLLGDRLHWSSNQLGLVGILIFSTGFLCSWLINRVGLRPLFLLSAGGLGLIRLVMQVWTGEPLVDMGLMIAGTVLFILFLPTALLYRRQSERPGFSQAILLGLIFDTALVGIFQTYDFIWQAGYVPLMLCLGLVLLQWTALRVSVTREPLVTSAVTPTFFGPLPWLAIGPFLFLQLLVFQNQARLAALTGWSLPTVLGWVLLAHLLGLTGSIWWQPHGIRLAAVGIVLAGILWPFEATPFLFAPLALLIGQVAVAVLLATVVSNVAADPAGEDSSAGPQTRAGAGLGHLAWIHGASMLLMVSLIFGYYVTFSLSLPYQNGWLLTGAGLVIGLCGFGTRLPTPRVEAPKPASYSPFMLVWLLILLPLFLVLTRPAPVSAPANSYHPLRIMTYNLHNGFNMAGQLDLEGLAQVIETQQPDIVALQEISRGWVVNGSVDMFNWFSYRLQMPYAFFTPASDSLWGQAVFSRYPISQASTHPLPPRSLPMTRSFGYLEIEVGHQTEPLHLINAHLHHLDEDSAIRVVQVERIINFLNSRDLAQNVVIAGDLNAMPDSPEIQRLYTWGFQDILTEANITPHKTYPSTQPRKRLDYLLFTPDLIATEVLIPRSTASDHLGIAALILKE